MAPEGNLTSLERLLHAGLELLDLASAAAVLMTDEGGGVVLASVGADAEALMTRQFELGVGPALSAHQDRSLTMTRDVGRFDDDRWSALAEASDGVRAVLAVPMQVGGVRLGVLSLHRTRAARWSVEEQLDAQTLADLATSAALDQVSGLTGGALGPTPQNAVVHQATGMLAARFDVGLADALARLRALAFAEDRPLYAVAVDIVTGGRTMDP